MSVISGHRRCPGRRSRNLPGSAAVAANSVRRPEWRAGAAGALGRGNESSRTSLLLVVLRFAPMPQREGSAVSLVVVSAAILYCAVFPAARQDDFSGRVVAVMD